MKILYFYDEVALDIDNILKPIQDALIGVVFEDDGMLTDIEVRRRCRRESFVLEGVSPVLVQGLELNREFVYVAVTDAPPQDVLA